MLLLATSEREGQIVLIGEAEKARRDAGRQLDRTHGVCARRESVDGLADLRHRAIDAILWEVQEDVNGRVVGKLDGRFGEAFLSLSQAVCDTGN